MRGRKPKDLTTPPDRFATAPYAPTWLSKGGAIEWRRIVPVLMARGALTPGDRGVLATFCDAYAQLVDVSRQIDAEGLMLGAKRHPLIGLQLQLRDQVRQLAAELGLTPVSRSRPAIRTDDTSDDDDPLGLD